MKRIIVDGHNLVPKIPGMSLEDPNDESQLIQLLGEYCRLQRVRAELFFDKAPAGSTAQARHGLVNVHHIRSRSTADAAIHLFLKKAGKQARDYLVVSSDHQVQADSRALYASVISSEEFSANLVTVFSQSRASSPHSEKYPAADEVDYWLSKMNENRRKTD